MNANAEFNRSPSTSIRFTAKDRIRAGLPKHRPSDVATWQGMFAAAKAAHGLPMDIELGLTHATAKRSGCAGISPCTR